MKRKNIKYAKCKCCGLLRDQSEVLISLSVLKNTDVVRNSDHEYNLFELLIDSNFKWACDQCIDDKKALVSNLSQQGRTFSPDLIYDDVNLICKRCKNEFTFTKEEKKVWYEQLKFYIKSIPVHCLICRKEIRRFKCQNKILSEVLKKNPKDMTTDELWQIVQIYDEWDKKDKFNFYSKLIKERLK
ncbi:zinc-ribbon domain containing protein [uncultured Chryseobacterium sp.]|uniref:zinc-ribbon domain containing protein n=1 Tax=uncultured Chryseobacterium sp. TaxID=259322 RepID=UPI0025CE7E54|nr:zinc-ribbon domain containing protein [uncultured Chryseobacterium sp.]